jgi:hypothetical protein
MSPFCIHFTLSAFIIITLIVWQGHWYQAVVLL